MSLSETLKLSLIEGNFSAEEAKEILLKMYGTKLNYHQRKNLSSNERFGKNDETSQVRIPILKENIKQIRSLTDAAILNNQRLTISSQIFIGPEENSQF